MTTTSLPIPTVVLVPRSTGELALDRTRLAHERTMMAWIRTSASMISFGFGIYKFFDFFEGKGSPPLGLITPRRFAIFLIATGLLILAGAAVQNWMELRELRKSGRVPRSLAGGVALLMSILGLMALFATIFHE